MRSYIMVRSKKTADERLERRIIQEHGTERDASYDERDLMLKELGFKTYMSYLRSKLWKEIRSGIISACPECVLCPRKATQVHHLRYTIELLKGEVRDDLRAVCAPCHKRIEFVNGKKRPHSETLHEFERMLRQASKKKSRAVKKKKGWQRVLSSGW